MYSVIVVLQLFLLNCEDQEESVNSFVYTYVVMNQTRSNEIGQKM